VKLRLTSDACSCEDAVRITVLSVDIDVDSNMDGNVNNDDDTEMGLKGIVVNINNDNNGGGGNDSLDGVINGAADKAQLTQVILRKLPDKLDTLIASLRLSVDHNDRVRIFDQHDTAVIGPVAADGGPNASQYTVPLADLKAGDVTYLAEACDHGHVIVTLAALDAGGAVLCQDQVRLVCNMDRDPSTNAVRFRINAGKNAANLEGMQARMATPKAKVNWAPTIRQFSSANVWISVQNYDGAGNPRTWMQTGLAIDRSVGGAPVNGIYAEVKYTGGRLYEFKKTGGVNDDWPASADYLIHIADTTTGKVECSLDGTVFASITRAEFTTNRMSNYQIGSEQFHYVDQNPGHADDKCVISAAKIKVAGAWSDTAFAAGDVRITDWDRRGNAFNPAASDEWGFSDVTATGYRMWDKVVEY
jgi:hypothetical protein